MMVVLVSFIQKFAMVAATVLTNLTRKTVNVMKYFLKYLKIIFVTLSLGPVDRFRCLTGSNTCIKRDKLCNSLPDCVDGSDELNCTYCQSEIVCTLRNGISQCISSNWICDGQLDCINGQDENNCNQGMFEMQYTLIC